MCLGFKLTKEMQYYDCLIDISTSIFVQIVILLRIYRLTTFMIVKALNEHNECRKTKPKVITAADHNKGKRP